MDAVHTALQNEWSGEEGLQKEDPIARACSSLWTLLQWRWWRRRWSSLCKVQPALSKSRPSNNWTPCSKFSAVLCLMIWTQMPPGDCWLHYHLPRRWWHACSQGPCSDHSLCSGILVRCLALLLNPLCVVCWTVKYFDRNLPWFVFPCFVRSW